MTSKRAPVALIILDGWGLREEADQNAVKLAEPPVFTRLWASYPHATLQASGEAVGLPAGQMGNSEVGHTNLGAGRIVYQDLTRIDKAISDGTFAQTPALRAADAGRDRQGHGAAPARPALGWRRAQPPGAPARAAATGQGDGRAEGVRARRSPTAATRRRKAAAAT